MRPIYGDFHIHVGEAKGRPVKIAAARTLTVESMFDEARSKKGLDVVTLIDAVCTNVLEELAQLCRQGRLSPLAGGGYVYENGLVVLLGAEVEVAGPAGGAAHFGCWFPDLESASDFHDYLDTVQTNTSLSSQRARCDAITLQQETITRGGMFIVHHAFTPHKGLYGNCVPHLDVMVEPDKVDALELGLSADTDMADCLSELSTVTFISDSDAHSLPKIAREYNALEVEAVTFAEIRKAFRREEGRKVSANFGLHPELGKYHRSRCARCMNPWPVGTVKCSCGSARFTKGVYDRLLEIRNLPHPIHPAHRPPYRYQVPLEFVPGLGRKGLERLLDHFGTEMAILNQVDVSALADVVGQSLATAIDRARQGEVNFAPGGGGVYGKVVL